MKKVNLIIAAFFIVNINYAQIEKIKINEFLAVNDSVIQDNYGEFNDWIEIFNDGTETINLAGFFLSDTSAKDNPYQIPFGNDSTIISPGEYILFWADKDTNQGVLHLNFKLSGNGEQVVLFDSDTNIVDSISFDAQLSNVSYGRQIDGEENWTFFLVPTPGATNNPDFITNFSVKQLQIYPNPVSDFLKIDFNSNLNKKISIYNVFGECVHTYQTNKQSITIDVSNFDAGIYFIEELSKQNKSIGKAIIKH